MKILYHNDPDGQAACAVAIHFESLAGTRHIDCIPVNFDKPFPYNKINKDEKIYILDYRPDSWDELMKHTQNITWIDHHETSRDTFNRWKHPTKHNIDRLVRLDHSGCVLTWLYFAGSFENMPYFLRLVEDRDIWIRKLPETWSFWDGLSIEDTNPVSTNNMWSMLLTLGEKDSIELIKKICKRGKLIGEYIKRRHEDIVPSHVYYRQWNGLRCAIINRAMGFGSETFEDGMDVSKIDIMVYATLKEGRWIINLYTTRNDIHVGKMAKRYGGGGHPQSAGFEISYEDFPFN